MLFVWTLLLFAWSDGRVEEVVEEVAPKSDLKEGVEEEEEEGKMAEGKEEETSFPSFS